MGCAIAIGGAAFADSSPSYNNMFIAYSSPADVSAMAEYAKKEDLGGFILWELRGDMPYGDKSSLLSALNAGVKGDAKPPMIMGYWDDWGVYSGDSQRAIPEAPYAIPGSQDTPGKDVPASNTKDLSDKLAGINVIAYSFVEAQSKNYTYTYYDEQTNEYVTTTIANKTPEKIGTLFFHDTWSDLKAGDCVASDKAICWFGLQNRKEPVDPKAGAMMGNFEAFLKLKHADANNPLGPLKKIISVGGYAHDQSFEDAFNAPNGIANFVASAKDLIDSTGLDGIDLDYENPKMTHAQSQDYVKLITALRAALPDKLITVATLSDPAYLAGARNGNSGFAPGTLKAIAAQVNYIDLMTYDFHGAYDYAADGSGKTGFLTNMYHPTDSSGQPVASKFSAEESVKAAIKAGVPSAKLSLGIPAYGRSLAGIAPGKNHDGLYQTITSNVTIPKGDLDLKACNSAITPLSDSSCGGMFNYHYIMNHMIAPGLIGPGFKETDHVATASDVSNGTTAYADAWSQPAGQILEIKNNSKDVAFNVAIGGTTVPDFFTPGLDKQYAAAAIGVSGKKNLEVTWKAYGDHHGQCDTGLDMSSGNHVVAITLTLDADPSKDKTVCSIQ